MLNEERHKKTLFIFNPMNRLLILLLLFFVTAFAKAQTIPITLKISDNKNEAVAFATIVVTPVNDSLTKQTIWADSSGSAVLIIAIYFIKL